jgi:hypothetical protein
MGFARQFRFEPDTPCVTHRSRSSNRAADRRLALPRASSLSGSRNQSTYRDRDVWRAAFGTLRNFICGRSGIRARPKVVSAVDAQPEAAPTPMPSPEDTLAHEDDERRDASDRSKKPVRDDVVVGVVQPKRRMSSRRVGCQAPHPTVRKPDIAIPRGPDEGGVRSPIRRWLDSRPMESNARHHGRSSFLPLQGSRAINEEHDSAVVRPQITCKGIGPFVPVFHPCLVYIVLNSVTANPSDRADGRADQHNGRDGANRKSPKRYALHSGPRVFHLASPTSHPTIRSAT